jgi:hypothetical protein
MAGDLADPEKNHCDWDRSKSLSSNKARYLLRFASGDVAVRGDLGKGDVRGVLKRWRLSDAQAFLTRVDAVADYL